MSIDKKFIRIDFKSQSARPVNIIFTSSVTSPHINIIGNIAYVSFAAEARK